MIEILDYLMWYMDEVVIFVRSGMDPNKVIITFFLSVVSLTESFKYREIW